MPGRRVWLHAGFAVCIVAALALGAFLTIHTDLPEVSVAAVLLAGGATAILLAIWTRLGTLLHDRHFARLVDAVPVAMFSTDRDGRMTAANKAGAAIVGKTPREVAGKLISDFIDDAQGKASWESARRAVTEAGERVHVEQEVMVGGGLRWFDTTYVPVRGGDGTIAGIGGISLETTARHRAEARERESTAKLERSLRDLERVNASIHLLAQMTDALQACFTVEESFDVLNKFCGQLLPQVSGTVYLVRASRDLLEPVASFGAAEGAPPEMIQPHDCLAMRRGRLHAVSDPKKELVCAHWRTAGVEPCASLCLPLAAQGDMLGLLAFRSPAGKPIEEALQQLARSMAEQIALSVSGLRLREQLRRQSIVDSLTGLYNRRFLDESMQREFARAERKSQPLSLLMLDLDHFKRWNDTRGHDAGDHALRLVGSELQRAVRGSDIACRFGGEEFAILMPETTAEVAYERADAIRERIGKIDIEYGGQVAGRITASIGVAAFPVHASDMATLMRAADIALYEAKGAGRDRVMMAPPAAVRIPA